MNELQAGDILIFKAGNDWIGKSIAWLTESDVSHAAMMVDDKHMVEMGAHGISASAVQPRPGDSAILLRLSCKKDPAPLVRAAQAYLDAETRYDFPALALLAGLIIYRKIRPTPELVQIIDLLLRGACVALDKLIQLLLKNPDKAMVCSQLVYQIYDDCGKDYRIRINHGLLTRQLDQVESGVCLAELAADLPEQDLMFAKDTQLPTEEALAQKLFLALQNTELEAAAANADLGALPAWTKTFLEKLEEFLERSQSNLPIDALFITPADLAYKAENLECVGKMEIVRQHTT